MSNFIKDCINGDALISEIDDYVSAWHNSDSDLELHEYLGMDFREYALYVEDESYLGAIINAQMQHIGIETVVESLSLAARSDDQSKSKRIKRWLKNEGLWN